MERIPDPVDPDIEMVAWSEQGLIERWVEIIEPALEIFVKGFPPPKADGPALTAIAMALREFADALEQTGLARKPMVITPLVESLLPGAAALDRLVRAIDAKALLFRPERVSEPDIDLITRSWAEIAAAIEDWDRAIEPAEASVHEYVNSLGTEGEPEPDDHSP